jgi:hypothetical protein
LLTEAGPFRGADLKLGLSCAVTNELVMELVEGDDLSQLIARRAGPSAPAGIPLDEALPIAKHAEALEAAHERGAGGALRRAVQAGYTNDSDRWQPAPDGRRFLLLVSAGTGRRRPSTWW